MPSGCAAVPMRRVSVVGNSGSGKTTLARRLATLLGVEHVELDAINHQPGWVELPLASFVEAVAWTWTRAEAYRRQYEAESSDPANRHLTYVRLRSAREADRWLASVAAATTPPGAPPAPGGSAPGRRGRARRS